AFCAGFVFLPRFGVARTNVIAASFNLTLAAAVLVARRLRAGRPEPRPTLEEIAAEVLPENAPALPLVTPGARRVVLAGFGLGADGHDPAGAVDARPGRGHGLVGVLV